MSRPVRSCVTLCRGQRGQPDTLTVYRLKERADLDFTDPEALNALVDAGCPVRYSTRLHAKLSVSRCTLNLLHEMPSPSSDWTARQPHARGWLG